MADSTIDQEFLRVIEEDVETAVAILDKEDTQYNRRIFVKNFYSFIDGIMHFFRQQVLEKAEEAPTSLTPDVLTILREHSYSVTDNGVIETNIKYLEFIKSFRLTINYYFADVIEEYKPKYGDGGWQALRQGQQVRNRITHPKYRQDLGITDAELATVKKGKKWCDELIHGLFQVGIDRSRASIEASNAIVEECNAKTKENNRLHVGAMNTERKHPFVLDTGLFPSGDGVRRVFREHKYSRGRTICVIDWDEPATYDIEFPVRIFDEVGAA
jgi:hypothetical protein